jgi:hydrogenase maturation factor HypE
MGLGSRGVGDRQSLQNVIVIILYHVQFLHGMSTFNGSSVLQYIKDIIVMSMDAMHYAS